MKPIKTSTIWREDKTIVVDTFLDGTKVYRLRMEDGSEKEIAAPPARPRTPAIHGMFLKDKPRYLHSLAQRPRDPNAFVRSYNEAERKAHDIGGEIIKVDDLAHDHPAHATGPLYDETRA